MKKKVLYSSVLQDFAYPLLDAADTNEMFITKMKVAELIWNYCIAKEFALPVFDMLHHAITMQNENNPEMKPVFNLFLEMKKAEFNRFKNFIVTLEVRTGKEGNKTVYVESVHPKHYNKIFNVTTRI